MDSSVILRALPVALVGLVVGILIGRMLADTVKGFGRKQIAALSVALALLAGAGAIFIGPEPSPPSALPHVTAPAQFDQEVLGASEPVLVDFYATWCPPCKIQGPILDRLSEQYAGRVRIVKVDVDLSPDLAGRYGIQSIPTLVLFDDGQEVRRYVGLQSQGALEQALDAVAPDSPAPAGPAV